MGTVLDRAACLLVPGLDEGSTRHDGIRHSLLQLGDWLDRHQFVRAATVMDGIGSRILVLYCNGCHLPARLFGLSRPSLNREFRAEKPSCTAASLHFLRPNCEWFSLVGFWSHLGPFSGLLGREMVFPKWAKNHARVFPLY